MKGGSLLLGFESVVLVDRSGCTLRSVERISATKFISWPKQGKSGSKKKKKKAS